MRAHYLINTERWDDPARSWEIDRGGVGTVPLAIDAFSLGYAAVQRGDRTEAKRRLEELKVTAGMAPDRIATILAKELEAAMLVAEGNDAQALALMREAAALEDALPADYGPPDVVKPTHEMLGELLLERGLSQEASTEFRRALELAPKRTLAVRGLAAAEQDRPRRPR